MKILERIKDRIGVFGEWVSIVGPIFAVFLYVHHENVHLTRRMDFNLIEMHKRIDKANQRSDELHKEFYDLLKETRKS